MGAHRSCGQLLKTKSPGEYILAIFPKINEPQILFNSFTAKGTYYMHPFF
jgi:hypothetical protein